MDEIGTPFCITVDYESVEERTPEYNTVTVRNRDDKSQKRVKVDKLAEFLGDAYGTTVNPTDA